MELFDFVLPSVAMLSGTTEATLMEFVAAAIATLTQVVGIFAIIAPWTPTKKDDDLVGKLSDIVNLLAQNYRNARNRD